MRRGVPDVQRIRSPGLRAACGRLPTEGPRPLRRRALRSVQSSDEEVALRVDKGYGGEHAVAGVGRQRSESLLLDELGVFIVRCGGGGADLR